MQRSCSHITWGTIKHGVGGIWPNDFNWPWKTVLQGCHFLALINCIFRSVWDFCNGHDKLLAGWPQWWITLSNVSISTCINIVFILCYSKRAMCIDQKYNFFVYFHLLWSKNIQYCAKVLSRCEKMLWSKNAFKNILYLSKKLNVKWVKRRNIYIKSIFGVTTPFAFKNSINSSRYNLIIIVQRERQRKHLLPEKKQSCSFHASIFSRATMQTPFAL